MESGSVSFGTTGRVAELVGTNASRINGLARRGRIKPALIAASRNGSPLYLFALDDSTVEGVRREISRDGRRRVA